MNIGEKVKNFKLTGIDKDHHEKEFSLSKFKGKNVVLYFYPKDETPGCTQEAIDFKNKLNSIADKAVVIGVSPDDIRSHKSFQKNHSLNFNLLSDPHHSVAEKFGVWKEKSMYGNDYMGINRSTFLIGKDGVLKKKWDNVKVKGHVDDVLETLEELT